MNRTAEAGGNGSAGSTPGTTPTPEPQPAMGTEPETGTTPEDGTDSTSVELRKAQAEAKRYRLELKEVREQLKAQTNKDLTEAERMEQRAKEVEAREAAAIQRERNIEVREAAVAAGSNAPEHVARLVDPDEEITSAIRRLKRELPQLFYNRGTLGSADGGSHGGGVKQSPSEVMDALIRGGRL